MTNFRQIWPELGDLAKDLGKPYATVGSWMQRGVPHKHFDAVIAAAAARGHSVTRDGIEAFNADARATRQRRAQARKSAA